MDNRSKVQIWYDAAERFAMANTVSAMLPLYIVTEYPKSGGTWVGQMLAEYMGLPFPRNRRAQLTSSVHHAHYLYTPFMRNVVCVMRDGRDIMVSFYFHMLFENEKSSPILVRETRRALKFNDFEDVSHNLPSFINYLFEKQSKSKSPFQFTWPQFVRSWINRKAPIVKYEDLIQDGVAELAKILHSLTQKRPDEKRLVEIIEKYSFAAQAKRSAGVEKKGSFLRKGTPGDWKGKFSREAAQLFDELAGSELILLGYEVNSDWVAGVE